MKRLILLTAISICCILSACAPKVQSPSDTTQLPPATEESITITSVPLEATVDASAAEQVVETECTETKFVEEYPEQTEIEIKPIETEAIPFTEPHPTVTQPVVTYENETELN